MIIQNRYIFANKRTKVIQRPCIPNFENRYAYDMKIKNHYGYMDFRVYFLPILRIG
jgi:hypothetical protein